MKSLSGNPSRGLFGATMGFFAGFAAVALFGTTASKFNEGMGLSPVMIGFLVAIPSLSGSLLRIPFGAWTDVNGGRKPFIILLSISLIGMLGLLYLVRHHYPHGLTASFFPLLLLLGVLSGCGIATFSVGIGQVSYWFPQKKQGIALGTYAGVGNLAPGIFSFFLPLVLSRSGLSGAYLIWTVFLGLGLLLYVILGRDAFYFQLRQQGESDDAARQTAIDLGQQIFPHGGTLSSLINAARSWKTWLLVAIYFATFGGFMALTAWLPTYWKSYYGLSVISAGALTSAFSLTASLVRVAGGRFSDHLGGERIALLSLFLAAIGAFIMTRAVNIPLSVCGIIIMAIGMGVCNAAVFKLAPQYIPQAVGGASGWIGGLGAFGGFAVPPLLGWFVRSQGTAGYASGFITFVFLTSLGLLIALVLRQTNPARRLNSQSAQTVE